MRAQPGGARMQRALVSDHPAEKRCRRQAQDGDRQGRAREGLVNQCVDHRACLPCQRAVSDAPAQSTRPRAARFRGRRGRLAMSGAMAGLEGTAAGESAALALALAAAVLHAIFGALQKGRFDPWVTRAMIDIWVFLLALPVALFVVPWPEAHMWPILAGVFVIHAGYKVAQAMAYSRAAYTVVYPVVRGTGALFAVIGAWLWFGESFNPGQWLGLGVLLCGIYGLAVYNLRNITVDRE